MRKATFISDVILQRYVDALPRGNSTSTGPGTRARHRPNVEFADYSSAQIREPCARHCTCAYRQTTLAAVLRFWTIMLSIPQMRGLHAEGLILACGSLAQRDLAVVLPLALVLLHLALPQHPDLVADALDEVAAGRQKTGKPGRIGRVRYLSKYCDGGQVAYDI